ncbi:uncharacterized protein LOC106804386 [Setaria italica]|uniref:uncharacterized protein LOC106804386 n=1 Tax=Setaria italica TaxID=4555 RepID=UPI0007199E3A|nr:uncharacterized protein LOC106804386 [Setaria italica]
MAWYVVHVGRQPGVYSNWVHDHAQVSGYKGACHKKYKSSEEAFAAFYDLQNKEVKPTASHEPVAPDPKKMELSNVKDATLGTSIVPSQQPSASETTEEVGPSRMPIIVDSSSSNEPVALAPEPREALPLTQTEEIRFKEARAESAKNNGRLQMMKRSSSTPPT